MSLPPHPSLRIAVDTGGTFTDCVWVEEGKLRTLKVFSTPDDPSRAIAHALEKIGAQSGITLLHGTTVGTNAILQRKGARVALITTSGLEDVIEIGRQARLRLYDLFFDQIPPLVARNMRFGVNERVSNDGRILESPDDEELLRLRETVLSSQPQAIAISLLFSFANKENESRIAAALADCAKPLSVSHQILPEFREYERTSTVVVNAYLQPLMQSYMEKLADRVEQLATRPAAHTRHREKKNRSRIFVMQSSGGIAALDSAAREPVRTVLSGPAGGLVGAAAVARQSGFSKILSFDMGGTSTDVAALQGEITAGTQSEIAGLPVGVPMLEIHTIGAGGGSLARFDAGGLLRVGPESAGADPGPICYGRGTRPTVTDANLLLGRIRPNRFLGGQFALDLDRTQRLVTEWLNEHRPKINSGKQLPISLEQFCRGIIRVVNANMERALRVVSIERGYDPRDFALVAFGGAGGLHACELAESLAIPTVILPARPGALSAFGILVSDVVKDFSRTVLWQLKVNIPQTKLKEEFRKLEAAARKSFADEQWQNLNAIQYERSLDLRYRGQGYELNIPASEDAVARFHQEHQRRYGYHHLGREIELVTVRLRAILRTPKSSRGADALVRTRRRPPRMPSSSTRSAAIGKARIEQCKVVFEKPEITSVFERADLPPLRIIKGPAVITEYSATTVIPPGKKFWVDSAENLIIQIKSERVFQLAIPQPPH